MAFNVYSTCKPLLADSWSDILLPLLDDAQSSNYLFHRRSFMWSNVSIKIVTCSRWFRAACSIFFMISVLLMLPPRMVMLLASPVIRMKKSLSDSPSLKRSPRTPSAAARCWTLCSRCIPIQWDLTLAPRPIARCAGGERRQHLWRYSPQYGSERQPILPVLDRFSFLWLDGVPQPFRLQVNAHQQSPLIVVGPRQYRVLHRRSRLLDHKLDKNLAFVFVAPASWWQWWRRQHLAAAWRSAWACPVWTPRHVHHRVLVHLFLPWTGLWYHLPSFNRAARRGWQDIQFMVNFGLKYKSHKSNNFSFNSYFGEGETLLVYENSGEQVAACRGK